MAPARVQITEEYSQPQIPSEVPVLIIGGGPVGLLQAYCLGKHGISFLVCERYSKRLAAPKAHALSPRTLEICRQYGLDTAEVRREGTPRREAFWVNFVTNLSSEQIGRLPYERMDADVLDDTPEMIHNIPQPAFEQLLMKKLADMPHVSIHKNISFLSLEQSHGSVSTTVEHRITGERFRIKSRYVLACDGMRSKVRSFLDIKNIGEDSYDTMMTIHFNSDLRPIVKDKVGMLHWVTDPGVGGLIIAYDLAGNQVLICNFDPEKHPTALWDEKLCRQRIDRAIGQDVKYDVLSWRPWILSRQVAESYRVGNVLLVGDAAHAFPPTGGLGLNSGLADAHNIAYKVAATLQGWATVAILDSYEHDRQQVAFVNSEQSVKNGKKVFGFLKTLGAVGDDEDLARQNLYQSIHDPEKRAEIDAHVEGQREHFDNARIPHSISPNYLNLHIGYVYGDKMYPSNASEFHASNRPGARLPHAWIRFVNDEIRPRSISLPPLDVSYVDTLTTHEIELRRYSTLDLCAPSTFTVLAHANSKFVLSGAVTRVRRDLQERKVPVETYLLGKDFDMESSIQSGRAWLDLLGLEKGTVVVVRPDQHILGVWKESMLQDAEDGIKSCALEHLGLE